MSHELSYQKAQIDLLERFEAMAQADQKAVSKDKEAKPEEVDKAKQAIERIAQQKRQMLVRLEKDYNDAARLSQMSEDNLQKSNQFIGAQQNKLQQQDDQLLQLKNRIDLLRREIEIGENQFYQKSFTIFFLKHLFVFGLFSVLVALLYKNNNISRDRALMILSILVVIMGLLFVYNLWLYRYRNANDFYVMDWPK